MVVMLLVLIWSLLFLYSWCRLDSFEVVLISVSLESISLVWVVCVSLWVSVC